MGHYAVSQTIVRRVVGWGDPAVMGPGGGADGFVLPTGMVAFLLTDVEGSTRLWASDAGAMAAAMDRHNEILDLAVLAWGGVRPAAQGEGDSIVAAFARASDAVRAAVDAQRALTGEMWPTNEPLRVRMAVHAGEARTTSDGNYAGQAIVRAARLRAIAIGGQVLVSEPARDLVVDHLGDQVRLLDLGEHRLRDLARPERVYQVTGAGLVKSFEPLRSSDVRGHNLPIQLSSFIGRVDDIATVADLVRRNRLVTIVGAGGAGKTRLAQQAAAELVDMSSDGTWWVELQDVRDAGLVVAAIGSVVGARSEVGDGAADALAQTLADQHMFIVLDNCEHLIDAVALIVDRILRACAHVRVLATSREPLRVDGEIAWRVPAMSAPAAGRPHVHILELSQFDAVRLFVDRAKRVRPTFALDEWNAAAVVAICIRLDGVPLAIELAAARCRSLAPSQVLDGLTNAFRVLTGAARQVVPRQATIEASITWSHELLSEPERVLMRRLSVFAGGFTLGAAEAVCCDDSLVARLDVLDLLDRLVTQSLVLLHDQADLPRYRLLETVRQYGAHRLEDAGEAMAFRDRHLDYYRDFLCGVWPSWQDANYADAAGYRRITAELENVTVALEHAAALARWHDYATMAIRAVQPLAYVLFEQACAMVDRVPDEAIADDRRLDAELAWARGMARSTRTDPRCAVEFSTAIQLGGDGVHPRLVAITTSLLTLMDVAAFPNKALSLVEDLDLPSGPLGDPGFCFVAMIAAGAGTGELTRAEPWTEKFDTYRERWPDGWLAVAGDLQAALIAWYRGDLHQIDQRCRRARDALAARGMPVADSAPGTNYAGVMVQAMECYAHAARGHAPIAGSLRLLGHARRQGQARPGDIMALAIGDGHRLAGDRKFAYDHLVDLAGEAARAGNLDTSAYASVLAGRAALAIGEFAEARRRVEAVSDLGEELRLGIAVGHAHVLQAELALVEHERGAANTIHTALEYVAGRGYRFLTVDVLDLVTAAAGDVADYREIARLAAAVKGVRNDLDYRARTPGIRDQVDTAIAAARDALGEDAFDRAFAEGRQLSLEDTVAYVTRGRGARARHATGWASLTPTEVDVVEAICRGLTNQQIGEGLLMSRDTVKTHLSHIYAKVGVANRAELAAQARRSAASS